jgi:hypothetical protein
MPINPKRINYDELAKQLLAIWDSWKSPALQAKDPNGRMKAMTELLATIVGPKEAAGYATDFIAEFADYDITFDGASPGEGANDSAEADRRAHMVEMLRDEFEE